MDVEDTDRLCNLQCVKGGRVEDFTGPIKVIITDPPVDEYCNKKFGSSIIAIANILIGATTVPMLWYAIYPNSKVYYEHQNALDFEKYNNLHIALCTIGFQICMSHGILMLQSLYGPAARLKKNHRIWQHWLLQIFGLGCGIAGTYVTYEKVVRQRGSKHNFHVYFGWATIGLAALTTLIGLIDTEDNKPTSRCLTMIHRLLGVSAYITSSICFCFALRKSRFFEVLYLSSPIHVSNMLIFCCIVTTVIVIYTPIMNFCKKNN